MNVPLGTQFIVNKELSSELVRDLVSFMDANNTGYFCITTEGTQGVEDALLVIESGAVVGAHYQYLAFNKEYFAGEGLKRVLNSFVASKGIYDAYTMSSQQLELLKIFNENMLLLERIPLRSFEGMVPVSYSLDFEQQEIIAPVEERGDVLKKHGLTEIKVDNFAEVKSQVESLAESPKTPASLADQLNAYLETGSSEPIPVKPEPVKAESIQPPEVVDVKTEAPLEPKPIEEQLDETSSTELSQLDAQADKLKKLLLKEK